MSANKNIPHQYSSTNTVTTTTDNKIITFMAPMDSTTPFPKVQLEFSPKPGTPFAQRIDIKNDEKLHIFNAILFENGKSNMNNVSKEIIYAFEHLNCYTKYDQILLLKDCAVIQNEVSTHRYIRSYEHLKLGCDVLPISEQKKLKYDPIFIDDIIVHTPVVCPQHHRPFVNIDCLASDTKEKAEEHKKQEGKAFEDHTRLLHRGFEELHENYKNTELQ
ncbi:hypothetical protein BDA99DRAFT_539082 [Phascolomyces articulosus]|uniref:Uncharacterized protein n=1 Tax=Phascolomyces articulosus TaxID=60185 RepID=A0AAD5K678_9FUNG|nr:hypothetical protein BDA99DRAFT_539082 [Phascolomyces articulosus]